MQAVDKLVLVPGSFNCLQLAFDVSESVESFSQIQQNAYCDFLTLLGHAVSVSLGFHGEKLSISEVFGRL